MPVYKKQVSDTTYGAGWNGVTHLAPSQNAVYDKIETLSSGGGETVSKSISQTTHGFAVGDQIKYASSTYSKAQADSSSNADVLGMVIAVADANNFTLLISGYFSTLSGLTANTNYFLSPSVAGGYTSTEPSTAGQVRKSLFRAISTTSGYYSNDLGLVIPAASSSSNPVVLVYGNLVGDSTTQFDITNPSGTTFRYTWDSTGTDPNINTTTVPTGYKVNIRATNMATANEGSFTVTGSGANYFEVTNASGVVESNKTITTGYVQIYNPTWTKQSGLQYIEVEVAGSGGGGGDDSGGTGSAGATSSLGSLISATGGSAGARLGGTGGMGVGGDLNIAGGMGGGGTTTANAANSDITGGVGGASFFGGGGRGGYDSNGLTGLAFGSGGGGGSGASESSGGGGGAGGYAKKLIAAASLGATETVTVAIGGTGATSDEGGSGAGGLVIIKEYY